MLKITTKIAIDICSEFELQSKGDWHIGLTGSCLYGKTPASKNIDKPISDIDIIIYRSFTCREIESPQIILEKLGIKDINYNSNYNKNENQQVNFKGRYKDFPVNIFFFYPPTHE